jgi:YVTN family beta-propeller protein
MAADPVRTGLAGSAGIAAVTATIPLGPVNGIAITPDGNRAYVAKRSRGFPSDNIVFVIDTASNTVLQTVPVGAFPEDVAVTPDGAFVYVTNFGDATLSVIETTHNIVVKTIPVR